MHRKGIIILTQNILIFDDSFYQFLFLLNIVEPRPKTKQLEPHSLYNSFESGSKKDNENEYGDDSMVHGFIDPSDSSKILTSSKTVPITGNKIDTDSANNMGYKIVHNGHRRNRTTIATALYNQRPLNERSSTLIILIYIFLLFFYKKYD